mgnify:CR=1 FL=1
MKFNRIITVLLITGVLSLVGCASTEPAYYSTVQAVKVSENNAEAERYKALGKLAESNDPTSKAIAALMLGNMGSSQKQVTQIAAPRTGWDTFIDVSRVWAGPLVNAFGIDRQSRTADNASNNATTLGVSTNNTFGVIAGKIQAPAANVTNTVLSGTGNLGSGTYTSVDNTAEPTIVNPVIVNPLVVKPEIIITK